MKYKLVTIFLFLSCSIVQGQTFNALMQDNIEAVKGNQAVVIWRVKVIDKTNYFRERYEKYSEINDYKNDEELEKKKKYNIEYINKMYFPYFEILKRKENYMLEDFTINPNNFRYMYAYKTPMWEFSEKDSASVLDELIITSAKPGDYFMDRIKFNTELSHVESSYNQNYRTESWYGIKAERKFSIQEEKLIYLGRIEIVIENFEQDPQVLFYSDEEAQQDDLKMFAEKMPQIYNALKDKIAIEKMRMLFIDRYYSQDGDFIYPTRKWQIVEQNDREIKHKNNVNTVKHEIKSLGTVCPCLWVKLNYYNMPKTYNISFTSKWKRGVDTEGFGLIWGKDIQNTYVINGSGNGYACVWYAKNGQLAPNPIDWTKDMLNIEKENEHLIKVRGEEVEYFVNDKLVGKFKMDIDTENWIIGFQVCNQQEVVFSNLIVEEME